MQYKILTSSDIKELEELVNYYVERGYLPEGGVSVEHGYKCNSFKYMQVVILKDIKI